MQGKISPECRAKVSAHRKGSIMNLPGVYTATKKDGSIYYRASITYRGKHISLGSFAQEQTAHQAYQEAVSALADASLSLNSYSEHYSIFFEKWVSLMNFRDNGLYIANPIYIRIKYFDYYLSPDIVLKFDLDDLFYYSSHKIMRRGNRLFVADYGMQTGIAARYGIKNYAVEGRDYRFVNGDCYDFRYENIELINQFHGVSSATYHGTPCFKAKIHINGDFVIGYYATEIEAAIAYNKAIDLLKKAGVTKQYTPNYVENISPSRYADLYNDLVISQKILDYRP